MGDSQHELLSLLEGLQLQVDDLRVRLSAVEARLGVPDSAAELQPAAAREQPAQAVEALEEPVVSWAPLIGWALLGISGAYVLRAATESGAVPVLAGVVAAVLYAAFWLSTAALRAATDPLAASVYAVTAAAIMTPLLWEAAVRFRVVSSAGAAIILVAFTVFGLAIAWRRRITVVACVATVTGLLLPVALFRENHDGAVWALTVLAIAAAVEFSACKDHWLGLRWLTALAADSTILALTLLAARSTAFLDPTFLVGVQVGLLGIYLASTAERTLIRKLPMTPFEIGQTAVAFVISIGGALRLAETTPIGWAPAGVFCLLAGATCYAISFVIAGRHEQHGRNYYTYSTYGLVLAICGCWLLLGGEGYAIALSGVASCLSCAGLLRNRRTLRVHGVALLALAAASSGVLQRAWSALIQTGDRTLDIGYFAVLITAFLFCATAVPLRRRLAPSHATGIEMFVPVALFAWTVLGALSARPFFQVAPLRTALVAMCCLAAAWLGARWDLREFSWVAYTLVLGGAAKVLVDDFRAGSSLSILVSMALLGVTLIALPRITRDAGAASHASDRSMTARVGSRL